MSIPGQHGGRLPLNPVVNGMKVCTRCKQCLPEGKFKRYSSRGRQAGTRQSQCNRCLYVTHTRPNVEKKTKAVHDYKMVKGCSDCGFRGHPAALEFDHLPGEAKSFNIGEKIGCYSLDRIWAEIAKCEVVCANCHAIRTIERRIRVEQPVAILVA